MYSYQCKFELLWISEATTFENLSQNMAIGTIIANGCIWYELWYAQSISVDWKRK